MATHRPDPTGHSMEAASSPILRQHCGPLLPGAQHSGTRLSVDIQSAETLLQLKTPTLK